LGEAAARDRTLVRPRPARFKESVSGDGPEANADAAPVTAETRALPQRSPAQLEQPAAQPPASVESEEQEVA